LEPLPEAGFLPGVKVHFVEAAKALGVKEADDVHVRASAGEHRPQSQIKIRTK